MGKHVTKSADTIGEDAAPIVIARRSRSGRGLIVTYPYCDQDHLHGDGGNLAPGAHGHRLAHCSGNGKEWAIARTRGYYLLETPEPPPNGSS